MIDAGVKQDYWIWYAENAIAADYSERVSVQRKSKQLTKFGRTVNADNGIKTTVMLLQGTEVNETFATGNTIDRLVSTDNADTSVIRVEGHTIDTGSGDLTFVVQDVTLTGQTPAALGTPLARCTRLFVKNGTFASPASAVSGVVSAYDSSVATTAPSGVPSDATATKCVIAGNNGAQQSEKCATSISSKDYWILTYVRCGLLRDNGANITADVDVEVRQVGGVWRSLGLEMALSKGGNTFIRYELTPYRIIPPNSDVRMVCITNTNDTQVQGSIGGVLAQQIPRR